MLQRENVSVDAERGMDLLSDAARAAARVGAVKMQLAKSRPSVRAVLVLLPAKGQTAWLASLRKTTAPSVVGVWGKGVRSIALKVWRVVGSVLETRVRYGSVLRSAKTRVFLFQEGMAERLSGLLGLVGAWPQSGGWVDGGDKAACVSTSEKYTPVLRKRWWDVGGGGKSGGAGYIDYSSVVQTIAGLKGTADARLWAIGYDQEVATCFAAVAEANTKSSIRLFC
jgi:hypothetical protein